jgi:hypothetical protein
VAAGQRALRDIMVIIATAPGYRLPFGTVVVGRVELIHTHRDRTGFTWKEPMRLDIHALAVRALFPPVANDNEVKVHA